MAPKRHQHGVGQSARAPRPRKVHPVPDVTPNPDRYEEAIHAFERRLPVTKDVWDKMESDEREYAFTVAAAADADMVTEVWEALDRALRDGTDFEQFKAEIGASLTEAWSGEDSPRLDTIFRTNIMSAYNAGREAVFTAPAVKEARPYSRFDAIDDSRTCPECEELNGTTLPVDDPFWDSNSPPIHFNDRCVKTGVSQREVDGDDGPDERPEGDYADDGFGQRSSITGTDWAPDLAKYPDEIADALRVKLDR